MNTYTPVRLFVTFTLAGIISGLTGALMIVFLHACVWVFYGQWSDSFMDVLAHTSPSRVVIATVIGACLCGFSWAFLRRKEKVLSVAALLRISENENSSQPPARFSQCASMIGCAFTQVAAVGAGNSIGRENAPRQIAAALSYPLARIMKLSASQVRLCVACAAGAALAAVYNTPLAAIAFTAGITLRQWNWRICLASAWVSAIATPIAWIANHGQASTPLSLPAFSSFFFGLHPHNLLWKNIIIAALICLALAICAGLGGMLMRALCQSATRFANRKWAVVPRTRTKVIMIALMTLAGLFTGLSALTAPQILGNGKNTLDVLYSNAPAIAGMTVAICAFVLVIKPVVTAFSLASGMIGGLLMPSCAMGASLGALFAFAAAAFGYSLPLAFAACMGAACVLAVTQRCGIFAVIFLFELAQPELWILPFLALSVALSVLTAKACSKAAQRIREYKNRGA